MSYYYIIFFYTLYRFFFYYVKLLKGHTYEIEIYYSYCYIYFIKENLFVLKLFNADFVRLLNKYLVSLFFKKNCDICWWEPICEQCMTSSDTRGTFIKEKEKERDRHLFSKYLFRGRKIIYYCSLAPIFLPETCSWINTQLRDDGRALRETPFVIQLIGLVPARGKL